MYISVVVEENDHSSMIFDFQNVKYHSDVV